jgi:hypothetical protein
MTRIHTEKGKDKKCKKQDSGFNMSNGNALHLESCIRNPLRDSVVFLNFAMPIQIWEGIKWQKK